jgi:hypothetical protein
LDWFEAINNKKIYKFVNFHIDSFYPSITLELLEEVLMWSAKYINLSLEQRKVVLQACKSFLFNKGEPWVKKGDVNFDVSMGAFHGAQVCELVGLSLLTKLEKLPNFQPILYCEDKLNTKADRKAEAGHYQGLQGPWPQYNYRGWPHQSELFRCNFGFGQGAVQALQEAG